MVPDCGGTPLKVHLCLWLFVVLMSDPLFVVVCGADE